MYDLVVRGGEVVGCRFGYLSPSLSRRCSAFNYIFALQEIGSTGHYHVAGLKTVGNSYAVGGFQACRHRSASESIIPCIQPYLGIIAAAHNGGQRQGEGLMRLPRHDDNSRHARAQLHARVGDVHAHEVEAAAGA